MSSALSTRLRAAVVVASVLAFATASSTFAAPSPQVPRSSAVARSYPLAGRRPADASTCTGVGTDSFLGVPEFNFASGASAAVLSGNSNFVCDDNSAIGTGQENQISSGGTDGAQSSFIGGGSDNHIATAESFIGAGYYNSLAAYSAVIGGGYENVIKSQQAGGGQYGFIGGGIGNVLSGEYAVVDGGSGNLASGTLAIVPGGYHNTASGELSFAGGYEAYAAAPGAFVWADYSPGVPRLTATTAGEFLVRASGGVVLYSNAAQSAGVSLAPGSGTWSSLSDRNAKRDIVGVDDGRILAKLAALPVSEWSYDSEGRVRHIGPMAQDFYAAFKVGEDNRHITTIDEDGVALAAVKAVHAENETVLAKDRALRANDAKLQSEIDALQRQVAALTRRRP